MALELTWGGQTTVLDLADGRHTLGGGPDDDLQVTGLPHRFLLLLVEGRRLTVTAREAVRVGAGWCPARVPRLLLDGEALALPGEAVLRRSVDPAGPASRKERPTASLARELLAGAIPLDVARAATLTCVAGPDLGATFPLGRRATIIGRAADADLRLHDLAVSRRHAVLAWEGASAVLAARPSTNGVRVKRRRLEGSRALGPGDVLELGQTLLRYDGPGPAPAPPATGRASWLEVALLTLAGFLAVGGLSASALLLAG